MSSRLCKALVIAFPKHTLHSLSADERTRAMKKALEIGMIDHNPEWYKNLLNHHYKDVKKLTDYNKRVKILEAEINKLKSQTK